MKIDAARAEISGTDEEIQALLASDEPVELEPPLLADGIRAARAPAARFSLTGFEAPLEAVADARAGALILPRGGTTALRACTPSGPSGCGRGRASTPSRSRCPRAWSPSGRPRTRCCRSSSRR